MMDFIFFLGRMHVLVLHVPIGVILLAVIGEWLVRKSQYQHLNGAVTLLWGVAAVTAFASVASGMMHFAEGGWDEGTVDSHRFYAILTTVGSFAVWILRLKAAGKSQSLSLPIGAVTFVLVLLTLFYGSHLTHGERFLTGDLTHELPVSSAAPACFVQQEASQRSAWACELPAVTVAA